MTSTQTLPDWSHPVVELPALARKRRVIRLAFGVLLALLFLSTWESYRIQQSQSNEARETYFRHIQQDDILYQLRRTFWLGSSAGRDFLLNPLPDRYSRYTAQLAELRTTARKLEDQLEAVSPNRPENSRLRHRTEVFWKALGELPGSTDGLTAEEKYRYVQNDIVPLRAAASEVIREFALIGQRSLHESDADFARQRRAAVGRLFAVLAVCGLLGLGVAWFSLSHVDTLERHAQGQYRAAEASRGELRQLAVRLMEVQEGERTRLSRELHDEIGQALATLRLEIARAEPLCREILPQVGERLMRAKDLAERSVRTVRSMCSLLRPSLLDDLGLDAALQWLAEDFASRTGISCRVAVSGVPAALGESANTCVFRVVQEALHNCEKHAEASHVTVSLQWNGDGLLASIEDDGRGFNPSDPVLWTGRRHLGILGMKERSAAIGGALTVSSAPARGTRIALLVPLAEPPEHPALPAPAGALA